MDLISVIVPVYKVEKYLDRCVESIVNQSYKNLEIILVDDGSPDNCPKMCDEWSEKDSRIKVIHKENGGLSDARNAGLSIAAGEYISFIDSDDWVHNEYFNILYKASKETNSDIVACNIFEVYDDTGIPSENIEYCVQQYTAENALSTLVKGQVFKAIACNKLFKQHLLDNEHFKTGILHEDEFFTYRIIAKAKQLAFVNMSLYYYFQRAGSITNTISARHFDVLNAYSERLLFFKNHFPNLYNKDRINIVYACLNFYTIALTLPESEQSYCKKVVKQCRKSIRFNPKDFFMHSPKDMLIVFLTKLNIDFTSRLLLKIRNR